MPVCIVRTNARSQVLMERACVTELLDQMSQVLANAASAVRGVASNNAHDDRGRAREHSSMWIMLQCPAEVMLLWMRAPVRLGAYYANVHAAACLLVHQRNQPIS